MVEFRLKSPKTIPGDSRHDGCREEHDGPRRQGKEAPETPEALGFRV